jgi:hypothetical protein
MKLIVAFTLTFALAPVCTLGATAQTPTPAPMPGGHVGHAHKLGAPSTTLTIVNDGKVKTFTLADLKAMPPVNITVKDGRTKKDMTWTGPLLSDVLAACGFAYNNETEHKLVHRYAVAYGTDGYAVVFSLPELIGLFHSGQTIVAIQRDGAPLTTIGQFTLYDSADIFTARRVSNFTSLEIRAATDATP